MSGPASILVLGENLAFCAFKFIPSVLLIAAGLCLRRFRRHLCLTMVQRPLARSEYDRILGAVIGKAMGFLDSGAGVIEVLVTLH